MPTTCCRPSSFLEFDDLVSGYFNLSMSAQAKLQEAARRLALPNQEIFRRIARAMGYAEPELLRSPMTTIIERIMGQVGVTGSFDDFKRVGTVFPEGAPVIQFPDLAFPTPSGKIEIASARAEADGHPRLPLAEADPRPENGRLRLLSPASPWLMNDSYANDRRIAQRLGEATVTLHPADAAALGLAEGQRVRLSNETGSLELDLAVAETIPPGVALSPEGPLARARRARSANVNVLKPRHQVGHGREHLRAWRRGGDCRGLRAHRRRPIRRCRGRRAWRDRSAACRRRRGSLCAGSDAPAERS